MAIVNDNFANSILLSGSSVSTTGTNVGATGETGEPNHGGVNFDPSGVNSVWYKWVAPFSGEFSIDTFGSSYDTSIGVYTGSSVNSLTTIAGNDDNAFNLQSRVTFNAVAGRTYRIAVDGYASSQGAFSLNLKFTGGNDSLFGTADRDILFGGGGNDTIFGNGGVNSLVGEAGNDTLYGGPDYDYLEGGDGNDVLYSNGGYSGFLDGGAGDDLIYGGSGSDYIYAGSGNDTVYGNGGDDYIVTGSGLDTVWLGSGAATVVLEAGAGFDTIKNFQAGQTKFALGSFSFSDLTFANSSNGAVISAGGDVLAVVSWQKASAINNAANFI